MFRRIWARPTPLAAQDLTVIPCVRAAIEETIALGAQVQEEALVVEVAVAGADGKNGLDRENNEHQVSLQHFLKNFSDRFHNRHFWICRIGIASSVRKKIRYQRELGI
jgi:hypothetical protein